MQFHCPLKLPLLLRFLTQNHFCHENIKTPYQMTYTIGKLGPRKIFEPGFDVSLNFDLGARIFSTQRPPYVAHILQCFIWRALNVLGRVHYNPNRCWFFHSGLTAYTGIWPEYLENVNIPAVFCWQCSPFTCPDDLFCLQSLLQKYKVHQTLVLVCHVLFTTVTDTVLFLSM